MILSFWDRKNNPVNGPVGTPKNPAKKPIPLPKETDVKELIFPLYFQPAIRIIVATIIKFP